MGLINENINKLPELPPELLTIIFEEASADNVALSSIKQVCKHWQAIVDLNLNHVTYRHLKLTEHNFHKLSLADNGKHLESYSLRLCPFKKQDKSSLRWNEGQFEPLPKGFNSTVLPFAYISTKLGELKNTSKKLQSLTVDFADLITYRENETRSFMYEDKYLDEVFPLPPSLTQLTLKGFVLNQAFSDKLAAELQKNSNLRELVLAPALPDKICPEQVQFLSQIPSSLKLTVQVSPKKFDVLHSFISGHAPGILSQSNIQIIKSGSSHK